MEGVKKEKAKVEDPLKTKPVLNLLFNDYDNLTIKCSHTTVNSNSGCNPMSRPIKEYLDSAFIVLDKPANPSSHEVASWIKKALKLRKCGHVGTLDPKVSGVLVILLGKATKVSMFFTSQTKEYICAMKIHGFGKPFEELFPNTKSNIDLEAYNSALKDLGSSSDPDAPLPFSKLPSAEKRLRIKEALSYFQGKLFQKPPVNCAVVRKLRCRTVYENELLEVDEDKGVVLFRTSCESGTYIRSLVFHLGLYLGTPCEMLELRRIRSGWFKESERPDANTYLLEEDEYFKHSFSLHDVLDAKFAMETKENIPLKKLNFYVYCELQRMYAQKEKAEKEPESQDRLRSVKKRIRELEELGYREESYLRTVVKPIEALFMGFKKIFVKDAAIYSLVAGAKLTVRGVVRFDGSIKVNDTVILVSMKGEAVYLGAALMDGRSLEAAEYGHVAKPKVVLMKEGLYPFYGKKKTEVKDEGESLVDE